MLGNQDVSISTLIEQINEQIRPIKQLIKITNDELSAKEVLVFMSLGYDDATKSQNLFPAADLEYFRILIEQIVTTENRKIAGIHALNLVGNMKSTYIKMSAQVNFYRPSIYYLNCLLDILFYSTLMKHYFHIVVFISFKL